MKSARRMWLTAALGSIVLGAAVGYAQAPGTAHFSYAQSTIGSGLDHPFGLAVDRSGNVYIADENNNRVVKLLAENPGH